MGFYRGPQIVTSGLVLHLDAGNPKSYPGTGTIWYDRAANLNAGVANNGTLVNGPAFNSGNGGSVVFDGSDDYLLGNTILEPQNNAISISTWFKPTGPSNNNDSAGGILLIGNNQSTFGYALFYSWSNQTISFATRQNDLITSQNNSVLQNTISNFTAIFNGSQQIIYLNGQLLTSRTYTTPISYPESGDRFFRIGQWGNGIFPRNFKGNIYQTLVYNKALTSTEVLQNYNALKSRYGL
jgi:hypothetical protein